MKIQNKLALISEVESKKYVSDYAIEYIGDTNVNEKNVDSLVDFILKNKLSYTPKEVQLAVTKLRNSDIKIPSKTVKGSGVGELDCAVFINNSLQIIIEDKEPNESVEVALDEAIFYADGLNSKGEDIRVVIGFNGVKILMRVLDHMSNKWVPFYINGKELNALPGKTLLQLIYIEKDIHGLIVEEINEDINIKDIISNLKTIYRTTDLQNNNQKTIDFTIAFIGLKSVLEKYINRSVRGLKTWEELNHRDNPNNNNPADDEDLRDNLTGTIDKIFAKITDKLIAEDYTDLFIIKDSENIETFNFKKTLETFKKDIDLLSLRKIYVEITKLHNLHDSKIDLFGEVYESLGEKEYRKAFGQFFTRRHIIKTLIELMDIKASTFIGNLKEEIKGKEIIHKAISPKTICDPACGTGGFLTEFFKYMKYEIEKNDTYKSLNLSELAKESFFGYDIFTANVTRTKINMYLAGDGFSYIGKADTLRDSNIDSNKFDYILANPPYGKGKSIVEFLFPEGIKKQVINNQRLEVNFLVKIVDMLKPLGRGMVIIPDGILEATTLSPLREWFLKSCKLEKVISLPKYAFAPYTHEKTYAIFFEKRDGLLKDIREVESDSDIWTYIVDNDGFANSDKRFRTDRMNEQGKYLHDEFSQWRGIDGSTNNSLIIERYKRKTQQPNEKFFDEWGEIIEGRKYGYLKMSEILKDEFISYSTVSGNEVLKKINRYLESKINLKKIFSDSQLTDKENETKKEILAKLEKDYQIFFDPTLNSFLDKNKQVFTKLKNKDLVQLVNDRLDNKLKIKYPNDMLNITDESTELRTEYNDVLSLLRLNYDFSKKTAKFWKIDDVSYKVVPEHTLETKIKKIFSDNFLVTKITQIIDTELNEVRKNYEGLINDFNLEYDPYEKKFFDLDNKIIRKTLILTPEKYFRQKEVRSVSLDGIKDTNKKLISELKDLLETLSLEN